MVIFNNFLERINPYNQINKLQKMVEVLTIALRPFQSGKRSNEEEVVPSYPWSLETIEWLSKYSDTLTIVQTKIRDEIFRNGYELVEAKLTDDKTVTSEDEKTPDDVRKEILEFLEHCNDNDQTIEDVAQEVEDDVNMFDDGYFLLLSDYGFNREGVIVEKKPREIISARPKHMRLVMNHRDQFGFTDDGQEIKSCPEHRDQKFYNGEDRCPICGKQLLRVAYRHVEGSHSTYYFKDEVIHISKYRPSRRLGFSPVMTLWQKTKTLMAMDTYMREAYEGKRSPKQMLLFNVVNRNSLKAAWDDMIERAQNNPHLPAILGLEQGVGGNKKEVAQLFDFMRSLDEMQYSEARQEMRTQMGAIYGVEPVFQGDISTSGGLNNEGMQITVTNRAVEKGQKIYNKKVFPKILKFLDVEGWVLKLKPSEEQDEMAKLERQKQSLENGQLAVSLGLKATYDSDTMEVVIHDGELVKADNPALGGFPVFSSENPLSRSESSEGDLPSSGTPKYSINPPENNDSETPKYSLNPTKESEGSPGEKKYSVSGKPKKYELKKKSSYYDMKKKLQRELEKFLKVYKRKPTEKELRKAIDKINKGLFEELKTVTEKEFKKAYLETMEGVEKELGVNFTFDRKDQEALIVLSNQKVLYDSFKGLSDEITKNLHEVIISAYKNPRAELSTEKIISKIKKIVDIADNRAETIARTEIGKVAAAARRISYLKDDPEDKGLYEWIGPNDRRTTQISKNIKKRVGKGKPWHELIKIVQEESNKFFPEWIVNPDFPVSHYNSRHTFIKVG